MGIGLLTFKYKIEEISKQYIEQYTTAVMSDWYNKYQLNKYKGNMTIAQLSEAIMRDKESRYVITANRELIGGIAYIDNTYIAYFILPEYNGRGIATDVLIHFTEKVMETTNKVYLHIMKGNKASMRVAEKAGYIKIKEDKMTATFIYSR